MKINSTLWWRLPQKIRFLVAGAYNTAFGYLAFAALFLEFGRRVHYLIISLVASAIAVASAFVVHRQLVFRSIDPWYLSFLRFCLSQCIAFAVGLAALYWLVQVWGMRPLGAQAIITLFSVILAYLLHRFYSFRQPTDAGR